MAKARLPVRSGRGRADRGFSWRHPIRVAPSSRSLVDYISDFDGLELEAVQELHERAPKIFWKILT